MVVELTEKDLEALRIVVEVAAHESIYPLRYSLLRQLGFPEDHQIFTEMREILTEIKEENWLNEDAWD